MPTFLLPDDPITSLDDYLATDTGGLGARSGPRRSARPPRSTTVASSGLRGRGGGGFPTGRKWAGVAAQPGTRRYVVCNGAEGEPGTFKDRALLRANPYQLVEGVIIAAFAVGADEAFIGLKAQLRARTGGGHASGPARCRTAGICPDCRSRSSRGPDEYLFGEEKAMLEVIEGKPPLPRWCSARTSTACSPPIPQPGGRRTPAPGPRRARAPTRRWSTTSRPCRTCPHILARGAEWFRSMGTAESPGTIVATVVGDVVAPDVGEVELGTPLRDGHRRRRQRCRPPAATVKAVLSGVANPVVTAGPLDVPLTYEDFAPPAAAWAPAGFIVYDDTACMVEVAYQLSRFLYIESCGQCPPCKIGSGEITDRLERLEPGCGRRRRPRRDRPLARAGHRRQPVLPRRRGAGRGQQHPARPSRRVRRAHRARPLPTAPPAADPQAGRPAPTARRPTTRRFWYKRPDWTFDTAARS